MDEYLKIEKHYRCSLEIYRDNDKTFWIDIAGHWSGCGITSDGDFKKAKDKAKNRLKTYIERSDSTEDLKAFKWLLQELNKTEQLTLF